MQGLFFGLRWTEFKQSVNNVLNINFDFNLSLQIDR